MSRGGATTHPGDATRSLLLSTPVQGFRKRVLPQPTQGSPKMAAEVGYKGERSAAHPSTSSLTLMIKRLPPLSPPHSHPRALLFISCDYGP